MTPQYVTFSNIIIDDIVLWDGRTFMGTLGGAGTHALIGMRIWSDQLGYVATVGPDFDPAHWAQLERLGADLRGVIVRDDYRTARAWQIFEPDERRIEFFRTDVAEFHRFEPGVEDMPADYLQARGFHIILVRPLPEITQIVHQLRAANPDVCLVWEPAPEQFDGRPDEFQALFPHVDLVSPAHDDARAMTKQARVEDMAETLLSWGASRVAIRLGAEGSLVCDSDGWWRVPAVPAKVIDVTGAGNAYCGGFLVGLGEGFGTLEAALRATVSASFAVEQFGVPYFDDGKFEEAQRRLAWARARVGSARPPTSSAG